MVVAMRYMIAVTGLAAWLAFPAAIAAHELPEGFPGFGDPAECGECHEAIYDEWDESIHSSSSIFRDGLHAAVADAYAEAMQAKGKSPDYHCAACHAPTADNMAALMKGEDKPDPKNPTNAAGVTCTFCHMADSIIEGEKFHSYRMSVAITGPDPDSELQHGWKRWSFDSAYEMCLGCHGKKISGKGGVICSMEEEGVSDCLPCHMPKVDGLAAAGSAGQTHSFHGTSGAHDVKTLKKGAVVTLAAQGGELTVTLTNPNPHYFPSTNPIRIAYVKVEVYGAGGEPLFANIGEDPSEDPQAVLVKVFGAGGKAGVPSWEAETVAKDTRLRPGEQRPLVYALPEGAKSARASLYYRFVPVKAMGMFGVEPDGVVENEHLVSEAELRL